MRKTIVSLLVLAATAAVAQADPLRVKTGAASNQGDVSFTLSVTPAPGSDAEAASVDVAAPIAGAMSGQDEAHGTAERTTTVSGPESGAMRNGGQSDRHGRSRNPLGGDSEN